MAANFLMDSGAILAVLDQKDLWHGACAKALHQLRLPALTSEAVLTELFHLIRRSRVETETAWAFLRAGGIQLGVIETNEWLYLQTLMIRYRNLPMDFADATLVYLAGRESISTVLTVDQKHFAAYRIHGKARFRVLPVDRP